MSNSDESSTRRRFLAMGTAAAALGLAGCSGGSDPDPTSTPGTPEAPCPADVGAAASENEDGDGLFDAGSGSCSSVTVEESITYHRPASGDLALDLYRRADVSNAPGVVFLHGGRWRGGSRADLESRARTLAEKGYVCACPDYRTSDVATYPAPVRDAAAAVQWLRSGAGDVGVDPERLATYGVSAGAHLATLLAVAPDDPRFQPDGGSGVSATVGAAVGISGAYDLRDLANTQSRPTVVEFMGGTPAAVPERYREASPVARVSGDDPSIQLLHGAADEFLPYRQTAQFRDALQGSGVDVSVYRADGGGHEFYTADQFDSEVQVSVQQFLDRHL